MTRATNWSDDYWLPLMQLYLRKPAGVKPLYSRPLVQLAMELHVSPGVLFARMCAIASPCTPAMERLWEAYGGNPRKLSRAVAVLRSMRGFNNAAEFYDGVEVNETFEKDFRPVEAGGDITPAMLILVLDLYFRLTPVTMVAETPEVAELARMMRVGAEEVAGILGLFQYCDPYLVRRGTVSSPLMDACRQIWQRFGNSSTEALASFAGQLKEYFTFR